MLENYLEGHGSLLFESACVCIVMSPAVGKNPKNEKISSLLPHFFSLFAVMFCNVNIINIRCSLCTKHINYTKNKVGDVVFTVTLTDLREIFIFRDTYDVTFASMNTI
jgi:hypothetical protein